MTDTTTPPTAEERANETSTRADGPRHAHAHALSERQRCIARRLFRGEAPAEIADAMGVSVRTVYWHVENVYRQTGAHSLGELFAWAYRHRACCGFGDLLDGTAC